MPVACSQWRCQNMVEVELGDGAVEGRSVVELDVLAQLLWAVQRFQHRVYNVYSGDGGADGRGGRERDGGAQGAWHVEGYSARHVLGQRRPDRHGRRLLEQLPVAGPQVHSLVSRQSIR